MICDYCERPEVHGVYSIDVDYGIKYCHEHAKLAQRDIFAYYHEINRHPMNDPALADLTNLLQTTSLKVMRSNGQVQDCSLQTLKTTYSCIQGSWSVGVEWHNPDAVFGLDASPTQGKMVKLIDYVTNPALEINADPAKVKIITDAIAVMDSRPFKKEYDERAAAISAKSEEKASAPIAATS